MTGISFRLLSNGRVNPQEVSLYVSSATISVLFIFSKKLNFPSLILPTDRLLDDIIDNKPNNNHIHNNRINTITWSEIQGKFPKRTNTNYNKTKPSLGNFPTSLILRAALNRPRALIHECFVLIKH